MFHDFRLLLAASVLCLSLAGGLAHPSLSHAAIAETQTAPPVKLTKTSDWVGWLGWLIPLTVASSIIYGVSQGSQARGHPTSEDKPDPSDATVLNETSEDRLPQSALTTAPRLAKADIVETLLTDLHSLDPDKRRQIIWELGQRGDSRAIQPLADLLIDSDSRQRSLILAAVSEIAVRSLKPMNRALMLSLQDESPDVRKNAIRDVTRLYDAMAQMSQLLHYATSDTDTEVQDTAHWALSQISRIRSLPESEALPNSSPSRFAEAAGDKLLEPPSD